MLIEAARRAEAAVKEMLALVNDGSASCAEIREALPVSKAIAGVNSAFPGRRRGCGGGRRAATETAGLRCWPQSAGLSRSGGP